MTQPTTISEGSLAAAESTSHMAAHQHNQDPDKRPSTDPKLSPKDILPPPMSVSEREYQPIAGNITQESHNKGTSALIASTNLEDVHQQTKKPGAGEDVHVEDNQAQRHPATASTTSPTTATEARMLSRESAVQGLDYNVPRQYGNLNEVAISPIAHTSHGERDYQRKSLEDVRTAENALLSSLRRRRKESLAEQGGIELNELNYIESEQQDHASKSSKTSRLMTELFTISYLIFFSILGTLARLGLQALTTYPGSPVIYSSVWPNFAGTLIMGFLIEDTTLFQPNQSSQETHGSTKGDGGGGDPGTAVIAAGANLKDLPSRKAAHLSVKKTIPLYIGLATGFCGSFTSFSAFIRDVFLALSNQLAVHGEDLSSRPNGDSVMAVLAVVISTVSISLSALFLGAHLAIVAEYTFPYPSLPLPRAVLDRLIVLVGWGCWIGAVVLSVLPPENSWRGQATFALVFAPLGCLARFYASLYLNGRIPSFPLGTFVVNIVGTAVLGVSWDLAHLSSVDIPGCQIFQGVEDGFCGCLTTVSTWAAELSALNTKHAYVYGATSVIISLAMMVAIMGGYGWIQGFSAQIC
jgi:fluoride exporter